MDSSTNILKYAATLSNGSILDPLDGILRISLLITNLTIILAASRLYINPDPGGSGLILRIRGADPLLILPKMDLADP